MFVYEKNGNIIFKSNQKVDFIKDANVIWCWFSLSDNLVIEDGKVKLYEKSKQFEKDIHKYKLSEKVKDLEFQNNKLEKIANDKTKKKMNFKKVGKFERELYLLKQMKQCWKLS
jgi:hypothetical protein